MRMAQSARYAWPCLVLILSLSGCSFLGSSAGTPTLAPEQIQATVNAMVTLTVAAMPVTLQITPTPTKLQTLAPARTPTAIGPTATKAPPSSTPTPSATPVCDRAMAGSPIDVTIPDDSPINPGQAFTKTWRLQNIGVCTWNKDYSARFFYGVQMSAPDMVFLIREVSPGDSIEIAVDMVAPSTPGSYQGNWKLANSKGQFFGIGPNGDSPFWVRIQVVPPQTTASPTVSVTPQPSATLTFTPTPTLQVQASGSLKLALNSELDLDSGGISSSSVSDLSYRKEASFHNLVPKNNAEIGIFGSTEPTPVECQDAAMSQATIPLESLSTGAYLCVHSDAGRFGWIKYGGIDSTNESASLDFVTWVTP